MSRGRLCDVKIEEQAITRKKRKIRKKNRVQPKKNKKKENGSDARKKNKSDEMRARVKKF